MIQTAAQLDKMLYKLQHFDIVAVDVETTGLNTRKDKIVGMGAAFGSFSLYVTDRMLMIKLCHAIKEKKLIGWNSYFDLEMIRNNLGIDLWKSLYADVQMMHHTLHEDPPHGLKPVAAMHFGKGVLSEQLDLKESIKQNGGKKNEMWKADPAILGKYCEQDCVLTLRLYQKFNPQLKAEGLHKFFYEEEVMPLYTEVTKCLQRDGIPVDVPLLEQTQKEIEVVITRLEQHIYSSIKPLTVQFNKQKLDKKFPQTRTGAFAQMCIQLSGLPVPKTPTGKFKMTQSALEPYKQNPFIAFLFNNPLPEPLVHLVQNNLWNASADSEIFNINSKDNLRDLFVNILKETPTAKTDGGKPKVDEEFLTEMSKKYEWVKSLQNYNKLCKLKSTYIDRFLESQEDGIFYPDYLQHGTVSGRYSGDFQQLPRQGAEGELDPTVLKYRNLVRSFFVAGPGNVIIDCDYESLEPHIFAHISNEDKIRNIFTLNHDFYSTIAIDTENLQEISADKQATNYLGKVDKNRRQKAKAYSLGIPYGMEAFKLAKTLEISQEEADKLIKNYYAAYPNLRQWMIDSETAVRNQLKITTQAGRVRRFPHLRPIMAMWNTTLLDNALDLWQAYNEDKILYEKAKAARRMYKNSLNNAKNFQIQSLAASVVNRAAIKISRWLRENNIKGRIALQVHDEIGLIVAEEHKQVVMDNLERLMVDTDIKLSVKLKAPPSNGYRYSEAK